MKRFNQDEAKAAIAYAEQGGQGLHVYENLGFDHAPQCFKQSKRWAHLYDRDRTRLVATARDLGVRVVVVHHEGTRCQHIDLCAGPLAKAVVQCAKDERTGS